MKRIIPEEEKMRIVRIVKNGTPVNVVCRQEGVSRSALYEWIKLYKSRTRWGSKKTINLKQVYQMERRLATLEEEVQIFRKSGCGTKSSNDEKIAAIQALRGEYPVFSLCQTLQILRSTYYQRKKNPEKTWYDAKNDILRPLVQKYFEESKERFGASKITLKLREAGYVISQKHVSKLMKDMGLVCKQARLRVFASTNRHYKYRRNRLQQNFNPDAPNKVWVSDITYARVKEDIYAICVVIDLYARKVLSHAISPNSDVALVKKTFQKAYEQRCPSEGLIFHSDQGSVYTAYTFRKRLRELKVVQSFSNPGTPYDNAVAESFFSMMKREELSHQWYDTPDELEKTVADYISYFNSYRPLQKLGNLTPDQYESMYWAKHK